MLKMVKFIIRDTSGHSQRLVPPEQADEIADEYRDLGYRIVANKRLINYGESVLGYPSLEVIPIAASG